MDGNADAAGITADLEWLQSVGVRGVQMFEGGMGTPLVVPQAIERGTPEWGELVGHAVAEAHRLGLEFSIASSPGWSSAGGPWVSAEDAMQKLVWSETVVDAGTEATDLADLPDAWGPYQDIGHGPDRLARDLLAVAIPWTALDEPLRPNRVTASEPIANTACLTDRRFGDAIELERDPNRTSTAWVEQVFDEPVTVSSVTIATPGAHGFGAAPQSTATLEVSNDGVSYSLVTEIPPTRLDARTVTFRPATGRQFRLTLRGESAESALPPLAPELAVPNVLRSQAFFALSEFALWPQSRIHHGELKAGFAAASDYYALDSVAPHEPGIHPASVIDVSEHLGDDGILRWSPPPGRWRILRFGYSPTGHMNGPAPTSATGLEVDKLDASKVERYFDTYLAAYADFFRPQGPRITGLVTDSIESGAQNATPRLRQRFEEMRGYDLAPWAPAFTGRIVGDAARTDAFLHDFRRTLAELLSSDYYATVASAAHRRGMTYYSEALEDGRPQLGDDLAMRSHADIPMGAAWMFDADSGTSKPTYIADLKGASSVAHVYGKAFTGAESMTAFHRAWSYTPRQLKHVADLELALGVTRFSIHTSPHQPSTTPPPGIGLAPFLGQAFTRLETWADFGGPWIDYIARCCQLLSEGEPAVEVAVFIGEEGPVTGLFNDALDFTVPDGIGYDYVDLAGLEEAIRIEDGKLMALGAQYSVLYLGGSSGRMSVRALRRIKDLVEAGATVVGRPPTAAVGLGDDEAEFAALVGSLWSTTPGGAHVHDEGLREALATRGIRPQILVDDSRVRTIGRRLGSGEIRFVANPSLFAVEVQVRSSQPLTAWDPVRLVATPLAGSTAVGETTTLIRLPPQGSVFLHTLGASGAEDPPSRIESSELAGPWELDLPGAAPRRLGRLEPWTTLGHVGYSGRATYRTEFDLTDTAGQLQIELSDVHDIARVTLNGVACGIVWTQPDVVDVTRAARIGRNLLEIDVANSWMNRLIAEAAEPSGELFAPVLSVYRPDAHPRVAGLAGTAVLRRITFT